MNGSIGLRANSSRGHSANGLAAANPSTTAAANMVVARSSVRLTVCGASLPSRLSPAHDCAAAFTRLTVRSLSRRWPSAGTTRLLIECAYTAFVPGRFARPATHRAAHSATVTVFGSGGATSRAFATASAWVSPWTSTYFVRRFGYFPTGTFIR